jgi:hypothetical protein
MGNGEEPTLFHVIKTMERREARTISQIQDQGGRISSNPKDITHIFVAHMRNKYVPMVVTVNSVAAMVNAIRPINPTDYAAYLEQPITFDKLYTALKSGGHNKVPRLDGKSWEFYITLRETIKEDLLEIINRMFLHKSLTQRQGHGITISLHKNNGDKIPDGYCPITLKNTDIKILARIMACRLGPLLEEQLTSSQYCAVPGKSIIEAVSVIRNIIAHTEITGTLVCVLYLDLRYSFDRIAHHYLFQILSEYGTSK